MLTPYIPAPTGPYAIGNRDVFLVDTARRDPYNNAATREVPVTIWYPTDAVGAPARYLSANNTFDTQMADKLASAFGQTTSWFGGGTPMQPNIKDRATHATLNATGFGPGLPVVLISPGFGMPSNMYSIVAEELASQGYVAVVISESGEAIVTEHATKLVSQNVSAVNNQWQKVINARVADSRYVLNNLASLPVVGPLLDLDRIAMIGHSYGGYAASETAYYESRIKVVVALDGMVGYQSTVSKVETYGLTTPVLSLGAEYNLSDTQTMGCEHASWNTFKTRPHGVFYEISVNGARHNAYSDLGTVSHPSKVTEHCGTIGPVRANAVIRRYLIAFLDTYLLQSPDSLLEGPSPDYPEVVFRTREP